MKPLSESTPGRTPTWFWLGLLIAASTAVRFLIALQHPALWILDDELIYMESARELLGSLVAPSRGAGSVGFYRLYPALIAPAFALFEDPQSAYIASKFINCLLMSSAAVPAYLLAKRVLIRRQALFVAVLTLAIPSMVYTAALMTENAFYPAFLWSSLAILRVLERPTAMRQIGALAVIALTLLIRSQAFALVPALVLALLSRAVFEDRHLADRNGSELESRWKRIWVYRLTWIVLATPVVAVLVAWCLGSSFLQQIAGQNRFIFDMPAEIYGGFLLRLPKTILAHLASLDLYVGILPFAAFTLLVIKVLRGRARDRSLCAFVWVALSAIVCNVLMVALFLAFLDQPRISDRNLFITAPFFFIALFHRLDDAPKKVLPDVVICVLVGLLLLSIDFDLLRGQMIVTESLALVAALKLRLVLGLGTAFGPFLAAAAAAVACALFLPRRAQRFFPVGVLLFLIAMHAPIVRATTTASNLAYLRGVPSDLPNWIDRAVGSDVRVESIWHGSGNRHSYWQSSLFNRSVSRYYGFFGPGAAERQGTAARDQGLDRLPMELLLLDADSAVLLGKDLNPVEFDHVLTHASLELDATVVALDKERAMVLFDVGGPVSVLSHTTGIGNDDWTDRAFSYTVFNAAAGLLALELHVSPGVHSDPVTLLARIESEELAQTVVSPGETRALVLPYPESYGGWRRIDFEVSGTGSAAFVEGRSDRRNLGLVCRRIKRLERPPIAEAFFAGVDGDGWSRPQFHVSVANRVSGRLSLGFWAEADNGLEVQRVVGSRQGIEIVTCELRPGVQFWCEIPIGEDGSDFSSIDFEVSPAFVPDRALGSGDERQLGLLPGTFAFVSPAHTRWELEGVHHDRWTGRHFQIAVHSPGGGELTLYLESNDKIFADPQTIVGRIGSREVMRVTLEVGGRPALTMQLPAQESGVSRIDFEVSPTTGSPGRKRDEDDDPRDLGLLCRGFSFLAAE